MVDMMERDEITCRAAIIVEARAREKRRLAKIDRRDYWNEHRIKMRKRSPEQITRIANALDPIYKSGEKAMNLYNCKSVSDGYRITKFTKDYVVESSYIVSAEGCDCPAGVRPVCRHRTMLPFFEEGGHIDDGWFFIWDTRQWLKPIGEAEGVAEQNERWKDPDLIRPQGAPLSNDDQGAPSTSETDLSPISEIVQSASDMLAGGPAPPRESTPLAPQTEPPSAEGGGFKFRRPKL